MQKLLVSLSVALSFLGSTLLMPFSPVLALTEEEIKDNLRGVPVFTITDKQGSLVVETRANQEASIARVYISLQDAKQALEQLQDSNPGLGQQAQVVLMTLDDLYDQVKENKSKPNSPDFTFVPIKEQVNKAIELLSAEGQEIEGFRGVPIFFATVKITPEGQTEEQEIYIPAPGSDQIPLFFEKEKAQQLVNLFGEQEPELADNIEIRVLPLEFWIGQFEEKNDEVLKNMIFIRSQEAEELVQKILEQQPQSDNSEN